MFYTDTEVNFTLLFVLHSICDFLFYAHILPSCGALPSSHPLRVLQVAAACCFHFHTFLFFLQII